MNQLGNKLKDAREKRGLLLRQTAAFLECDTAFISKVEHGERYLNRDQVRKVAEFYEMDVELLITLWLADKVINLVGDDPLRIRGVRKALNELTD